MWLKSIYLCILLWTTSNGEYAFELQEQFQKEYDRLSQELGRNYMESIEFIQPEYDKAEPDIGPYDFIIVGSGPAGCALANRLTENENFKVLLLEAGKQPTVLMDIPSMSMYWAKTEYFWFDTDNPAKSLGTGKTLGGGSNVNYLLLTRGHREDYDKWAKLGNPEWSYDGTLPYFKKLENVLFQNSDEDFRGFTGPVPIDHFNFRSQSVDAFIEAAKERGATYIDYNGKSMLGVSHTQVDSRHSIRGSAEKSYLRGIKNRQNLKILTKSLVTSLIFDPLQPKTVRGVEYIRENKTYNVLASKEVILSAGAINTAKLLMLSGIGPKTHLEELGIPTRFNAEVGTELHDHYVYFGTLFELNQNATLNHKTLLDPSNLEMLVKNGSGPLTISGVEGMRFLRTKQAPSSTSANCPDVEIVHVPFGLHMLPQSMFKWSQLPFYDQFLGLLEDRNIWQGAIVLFQPQTHGSIRLRSKDPLDSPDVDPGGLVTQVDKATILETIRELIEMCNTKAYQELGCKLVDIPYPGCENFIFNSDDYWSCTVEKATRPAQHLSGSTKMGPSDDTNAVVDQKCRVYGINGLRVVDTGIIPVSLNAHTLLPAYMIGEKASDIIKADYPNVY